MKQRWSLIGMHLYIFPPEPAVGDLDALRNWRPVKMGLWPSILFRVKFKCWAYAVYDINRKE